MDNFKTFSEDLASGRPAKKPVSSNLLKQRAKENKKAMDTGFMKMPDYARKKFDEEVKPHKMYKGDKVVVAKNKEDHDKLSKQGYTHEDPKGKKEMKEQNIFEISDALKKRYMAKAGKEVSGQEHMRDYLNKSMDKKPGSFTTSDKDFVNKRYDKETLKRRKGMRMARSKMAGGTGGRPRPNLVNSVEFLDLDTVLVEKSTPTNPSLWSKAKAAARSKFDVYPSAYANGWAVQWYKKRGGGWKKGVKEEINLAELSPATISSYQKKAGKQYKDLKKSTMSATSREGGYHKGYISQKEYDAQHDMADKKARRGKGLAMSKGKGEKDKYGRSNKMYFHPSEEHIQLVTNLNLDEAVAAMVKRGLGRVKDTLQQAGQQYKDHQAKQMKAGKGIYQNPVSGENIARRRAQMQKKRLMK